MEMFRYTYSARSVADALAERGIPFTPNSTGLGGHLVLYEHGLLASFDIGGGHSVRMSIQTHPMVAGASFAETALNIESAGGGCRTCIECVELGYGSFDAVLRHHDPKDLYAHLDDVHAAMRDDGDGPRAALRDVCDAVERCNATYLAEGRGELGALVTQ